ncbi:translation factor GTPase family protein [Ruminococcus flavefaciens]|uniref:translation factor GTPase family protein n=1 Tax=Ruminococcus flavefaciens TaxID=1265 RepID=UPI0026EED243|nr:TetM/TetW/TetO/TetS family tetracycline resistance ribosomal protection protein [Ruminococcus flavefaciens]MDD7515635.1 TetM/TetW/TetO/TetS family tetracycline resistance ribosomal protection protein [Ruminococcus flavefaciens]MDY5690330.1 translation factor GTPase family protein [Ruminococcus flavefaciens]
MKKVTVGITAHVDSGKTTLAEAMLYKTGAIRKLGRVDNGNSTLDTNSIERERGITIFSAQAELSTGNTHFTLLDTPGHVDFSAETERTMCVLDYAILVISGTDGVQSHTTTLWKVLRKYEVPTFIFVNKMDLIGAEKSSIIKNLSSRLSGNCVDFTGNDDEIAESCSMCCEEFMEHFITHGTIENELITKAIAERRIFPCFFGSALKMDGIDEFISGLDRFTREYESRPNFSAQVYKISYDQKGSRLTHLKVLGGQLKMREELTYKDADGNEISGKISSIRFYSGEKFRTADYAEAGEVCAVTGLVGTFAGQGLGCAENSQKASLEPVMTYKIVLPDQKNIYEAIKELRLLEDEDPQLHILWNEQNKEIHIQLMGAVQLEVLSKIIEKKFGYSVSFSDGAVTYKETIRNAVEGVGHYEPLRHYAEAHILLEPLPTGSGLQFAADCSEDKLDKNWQRLILTHLTEKTHLGVLTGSPITDIKLTLVAGKAHLKHTEGGDFRQATYRAIRQGLRNAESVLLEPYYNYEIEVPTENVGRVISDLQHMSADFDTPENIGEMSIIRGCAPVSEINDYQTDIIAFTHGKGKISFNIAGYRECHNAEAIINWIGYNCDSDVENSADSIFCSHGAGYIVKWNEVYDHMHLPLTISEEQQEEESSEQKRAKAARFMEKAVSDEELMEIFERTYGKINRDPVRAFKKTKAVSIEDKKVRLPKYEGPDYLLVDGYNIIFAWEDLKKIADDNLDAARGELINRMCNYQGYDGSELILVFDAYRVKGKHREVEKYCNINIVYTKESETADSYIERVTHELSKNHRVRVATSDGIEQMIILGNGAMRISATEFRKRYEAAERSIREYIDSMK